MPHVSAESLSENNQKLLIVIRQFLLTRDTSAEIRKNVLAERPAQIITRDQQIG